ncbi:hypothetical protein TNIN_228201 [Trichonephila inaurata madagascariensis]|uniref:Uncharacterized protein n=1 Tax=Trichonephila inaurata madagascariensis TaxID=2747483 RepID=A0A8X7CHN7_9ARAC|nr:hypothetical protein TNIN_228201 [Trichonephila inaurata madagascariensis]
MFTNEAEDLSKQWKQGQRNRPDHVNHDLSCLERFAKDAKDVWAFSEDEEDVIEETDEKVCGCRHFQPVPREMYGRRKLREGSYAIQCLKNPICGKKRLTMVWEKMCGVLSAP